jgi:hypothetical protein
LAGNGKRNFPFDISGRCADLQLKVAQFHHAPVFQVDERQVAQRNPERDRLCFAGLERDFLESLQPFDVGNERGVGV